MTLPATYLQKLISLVCICLAFIIAMGLPKIGHIATGYLLIYAAILYLNNKLWPIILLFSVPLLNFTPYSGRYAITEFDSLVLLTFGMVWIKQNKLQFSNFQIEFKLFLLLICVVIASSFNALSTFPSPEDIYLTVYQQPLNIWRVGKSLPYALLLYLLIHNADKKDTGEIIRNIAIGAFVSIIAVTLIILWEKSVIYRVFSGSSLRSILGSALFFSIDFRPTALFSAMHTGGGSLDSYISILFIFFPLLLFGKSSSAAKYIFLLALLSGLYCALATVSRTVIAAAALTTAITVIFYTYQTSKNINSKKPFQSTTTDLIQIAAVLILLTVSLILVQPPMGTEGILSLPAFTLAFTFSFHQLKYNRPYIFGLVFIVFVLLLTEALLDRLDKGISTQEVLYKGGILIGLICLNSTAFILKFRTYDQLKPFTLPLTIFISAAMFISMGFSSASLANRLSEITKDTGGREHHWNTVMSTGSDSLVDKLFGNGPGTMPLNYRLAFTGSDYFTVRQIDPANGTLSILGSGQALLQRIKIKPGETYTLQTSLRSEDTKGSITLAICNRNIIIQTTHNGTCKPKTFHLKKKGKWKDISTKLSIKDLRQQGLFDSFTNLEMKFYRFTEPVEIRYIGLSDSKGNQILFNPGFEQNLDYWFWASDFHHLGWHSKNAFLHQYFELGAIGLLLTLSIIASITLKTILKRKNLDLSIQITAYSIVLCFILLGSFITVLDDPQIATFWYLGFLITSLLVSNTEKIFLPTIQLPNRDTFNTSIINRKTRLNSHWEQKKKTYFISLFLIVFLSISTDFYTQYVYNTSPPQVLARFNHSKAAELKNNDSPLNFVWNFIASVAPEDERFIED